MPYLTVGKQRLEYEWIGPGPAESPTLVFLHEGLGCLGMWKDFPPQLAAHTGCGAFIYSRSGYGDSTPLAHPRTSRYLHDEALTVLPAVLQAMDISQPILIGHSDGASLALIYAGSDTSAARGLILEAPHVFVEDVTLEGIRRAGETYRSTDLAQKLARFHGDQTNAVFWGWYDTWLSPEFRDWNIAEYLPQIKCPVMIIQGEGDEYGTKKQVDAITSQIAGPVEVVMLSDCGHTPHRDQREQTTWAAVPFIKRVVSAAMKAAGGAGASGA
ncbi:MAG: alpha/beta hydrolase [Acidiferrobacterales bacterium]